MALTDKQIKNLKPTGKKQMVADGGGLALVVTPAGSKRWVFNFRFEGKQKTLSIGLYPDVSLVKARERHLQARMLLADGIDPAAQKQEQKRVKKAVLSNTFAAVAARWHADNLHRWDRKNQAASTHAAKIWHCFERDVFPELGDKAIGQITVKDAKAVIDGVLARDAVEIASKIRQWVSAVFEYAMLLELVNGNPAAPLRKIMPKRDVVHRLALPKNELPTFFGRLQTANVDRQNQIALLLLMLVFVRSNELRGGLWQEIDFEQGIWTIPFERLKGNKKQPHVVPLSSWALDLLCELHDLTGYSPFLFPSRTRSNQHISENTLNQIMNRMGYKGIATPHGFRSLASSTLNEQGFNRDAIERQLAHVESDKVRAAYNRADYLDERRKMMQWYSDFLFEYYQKAAE